MGEMPLNPIEILELTVAKLQTELLGTMQRVSVAEEKLDKLTTAFTNFTKARRDDLK